MGLVDLFRPKWKHSDVEVRASAVRELGPEETDVLSGIAKNDDDVGVRRIAIKKLDDPLVLGEIAQADPDESLRQIAADRANSILVGLATSDTDQQGAVTALEHLRDEKALVEVAKRSPFKELRLNATAKLTDQRCLADVARHAQEPSTCLEALRRVTDLQVLRSIALNDERKEVALAALERIEDKKALEAIARKGKNKTVRGQARKQLNELTPKDRAKGGQQTQWAQLCQSVEILARSSDWEASAARIEELKVAWDALDGTPADELAVRFASARDTFFERYARHQKQRAEREQRDRELQEILSQRIGICEEVESLEGESALTRMEELCKQWEQLDPIPEAHEEVIEQRFAKACEGCQQRVERWQEHGEVKLRMEALCSEAEQLLTSTKTKDARRRYRSLTEEWQGLSVPPGTEELQERFFKVNEGLDQLDEEMKARKEQQRQENLAKLTSLCERIEGATDTDDLRLGERLLRDAQSALKRLGVLPSKESREELGGRLQVARDKLFTRVQELREADEWKRWSVTPKLEALCVEVEALAEVDDLKRVSQRLKRAQADWKKVGPAPKAKAEELWKRFKKACDQAFSRCQEHFAQAEQDRTENLEKKRSLCEQVEAVQDSTDWAETATAIKEVQAEWKKVGPVPKSESEALWARFRQACDHFFNRRQEHLDETSGELQENLARKEALCEKVEALADSTEWNEAAEAIKLVQAEWKKIGPVPRAQSKEIWARFRQACDHFFNRRQQHMDQERIGALAEKEALCQRVEALLPGSSEEQEPELDPDAVVKEVFAVRAEWRQVGPVPRADSETIWDRFCQACERVVESYPKYFQGSELDPVANLQRKEQLCEQVEALIQTSIPEEAADPAESMEAMAEQLREALAANTFQPSSESTGPDWQAIGKEVKRLQAAWKRIGPVPGEAGEAIWKRFRKACDQVFEQRQQSQAGPPETDQRTDNFQQKQVICEEAEALAAGENLEQHRDAIRELRRRWKATGPVPKSKARRLWNRFRRACNKVMAAAKAAEAGSPEEVVALEVAAEEAVTQPSETSAGLLDEGSKEAPDAEESDGSDGEGSDGEEAAVPDVTPSVVASSIEGGWDESLDSGWDDVLLDEEPPASEEKEGGEG